MKKLRNILITLLLLSIVLIIINFWLGSMFEEHEQSSTGQTLYIVGGVGALGSILGLMVIGIMRFVREFRGAIKEESARARVQASKNNDAQSKFVASLSDADLNIFLSAKRKYRPRKIAWYTASIGVLVGFFGGIIGIIATQGLIGFYWVWFFGLIILSIASYVVFYTLMMRAEKIPDDKLKTARGTVYALHPEKVVFVPDAERLLVIMVGKDVDVSRLPKVGASVNVQYNGDKPRKCLIARTPRAPRKSTAKKSEEISDETIALDADPEV